MIKSVIIDDKLDNIETLENALKIYCPKLKVVGRATSVKLGIDTIKKQRPEIVFLDIELTNKSTSFEIVERFEPPFFEIVFVTAYEEYALKAIEHIPSGYLIKPIDPEKLQTTVTKAIDRINRIQDVKILKQIRNQHINLSLSTKSKIEVLNISNIIRLESFGSEVHVHSANWEKVRKITNRTLNSLEDYLSKYGFLRVQQSHLVNLSYIRTYLKGRNKLIMADGSEVSVSRERKGGLLDYLLENN